MASQRSSRGASSPRPVGRRRGVLTLLFVALAGVGAQCPAPLPPLAWSDPPDRTGGVSPSAWITLSFTAAVRPASRNLIPLFCNGALVETTAHALAWDTLVLNPKGSLPVGADCRVLLTTEAGPTQVVFETKPAGSAFETVHDRRDRNVPLPFPDDFFLSPDASTATGLRLDAVFPDHSPAVNGVFRAMGKTLVDADGWSPIGSISVQLSAAPDPQTLPLTPEESLDPLASVGLFDLSPASVHFGERIPFELTVRSDQIDLQPPSHILVLFPGIPLSPGGRYGLVVTRRVRSLDGQPLAPSGFFAEVLEGGADDLDVVRARSSALEVLEAIEALEPVPIPRDDVALAVRLSARTLHDLADDVLALRDDVLEDAVSFTIDSVEEGAGSVAAIVHGSFRVPRWRNGAFLMRDREGRPSVSGRLDLPFVLALPRAAETGGVPIAMYQHGNPGSAESEVPESAGSFLAAEGFAVAGFTDTLNRDFGSLANQALATFSVLLATGRVPEFWSQTYAEQIAFLEVLRSLGELDLLPLGAPDGVPDLDPEAIVYEGISYGSNHGQAFLAYAPSLRAASLVVGAQRFAELVEYQDRTTPLGNPPPFTSQLPSLLPGVHMADVFMGLALYQMVSDGQDPHNHASLLLYDHPLELEGTTKRASILVLEGIGDTFTKNNTTRSLAFALGPLPHLAPQPVPVSYLPGAEGPVVANIDPGTSAAYVQFVPLGVPDVPSDPGCSFEIEGHFCAQSAREARRLRVDFYRSAIEDPVPTIGPVRFN
ncbi:MAG: hypothetical protein ABFS46_05420 [Myxococcota bacterium]